MEGSGQTNNTDPDPGGQKTYGTYGSIGGMEKNKVILCTVVGINFMCERHREYKSHKIKPTLGPKEVGKEVRGRFDQCCGAENISFGSGSGFTDPQIRIAALAPNSFIRYPGTLKILTK
jgi:hypothetical protein